jgi:hypothetical protein
VIVLAVLFVVQIVVGWSCSTGHARLAMLELTQTIFASPTVFFDHGKTV